MVTITLPPELEKVIAEQAERQGTTPETLVVDKLREQFLPASLPEPPPGEGTMADFLADFIGCISSKEKYPEGSDLAANAEKKFAELMVEKRKRGKI